MKKFDDFLFEIQTEELPPKALLNLAESFKKEVEQRLQKAELSFKTVKFYATPRRLAIYVTELATGTKEQLIERKGPAKSAAFDKEGKPTPACLGFARSVGVTKDQLETIITPQGEYLSYKQLVPGKSVAEILPAIIEQSLNALPIPKRMHWGASDVEFVRPVHAAIMLYGDAVIPATILGLKTDRVTYGHRFHAPQSLSIPHPNQYEEILEKQGYVIADFEKRRNEIVKQATALGNILISSDSFLNEVTNIVEWPVAIKGNFDEAFLQIPQEVLVSSMQEHQRYFPVCENAKLLPHFITISNIESRDPQQVIHGNERVLRARLADAAFFFEADKKESLDARVERLKTILYQAKLGTLFDKTERVAHLADIIARLMNTNVEFAKRAAYLAKADLTSNMVNEFPELQGTMGGYYAAAADEPAEVAKAIAEHYQPRYAADKTAATATGQVLALADRIDTLAGSFGVNQIPTGDKDPYGLRRAAVGIIRTLVENKINLDLQPLFAAALAGYKVKLENTQSLQQILVFVQERLRAWYQEQGVSADIFASVAALQIHNPVDMDARIKAVQAFKKLSAAETLSIANKRVSNILSKYSERITATEVDPNIFDNNAEKELSRQLKVKSAVIAKLSQSHEYEKALQELAELRQPIDNFFDEVMVMTDEKPKRENRLLLLSNLRALFLQVADIALLQ